MIIRDIDFFAVELPSPRVGLPIRSILVRVSTHDGFEGWGETRLKWTPEELLHRKNRLLPALSGRSVFNIEEVVRIEELRNSLLCWGVECACWDLIGKLTARPINHFFGGEYRNRIPLIARLYGKNLEEITTTSMELANQGFRSQVFELSGRVAEDRMIVRTILETFGHRIELRLDGACRFSKDDALSLCKEWEDSEVRIFVDPLLGNEIEPLRALQGLTSMRIGVRRAIRSPGDTLEVVRTKNPLFPVIEPQRIGSLHFSRKCADIVEAAGVRCSLAAAPSVGISTSAALQLIAALPAFSSGKEGIVFRPETGVLKDRDVPEISDGLIRLPQGPGLGVEVDRTRIDRFPFRKGRESGNRVGCAEFLGTYHGG